MKNLFKNLVAPDSPTQYSAWFSENSLTTATVPPLSHYKVYYHIYGGKDMGAYYVVYLKDNTPIPGVNSLGSYIVDRGYVNRGSQVDKTRDLTAASGFKQLCINVNGQDTCGFGKVSTSYALNSLSETFTSEEVKEKITRESDCVAGTPSLGSLLQPNVGAAASTALNPSLASQGIIRICASENPSRQILPNGNVDQTQSSYDKWQAVGYCDDLTITCWLDTSSVRSVIRDKALEASTLQDVSIYDAAQQGFWTEEESKNIADQINEFITTFRISPQESPLQVQQRLQSSEQAIMQLTQEGASNVHRARGYFLRGALYNKVSTELWKGEKSVPLTTYEATGGDLIDDGVIDGAGAERINNEKINEKTSPSPSDKNFQLRSDNKIVNAEGTYSGFYIRTVSYSDGVTAQFIYQSRSLLLVDPLYPDERVGQILNNKIVFDRVDTDDEIMRQLNGLSFEPQTKRFYS